MKCDYGKCEKEATTQGQVWSSKTKEFVRVNACKFHKKRPEFFKRKKG